jgi:hypothetical protein
MQTYDHPGGVQSGHPEPGLAPPFPGHPEEGEDPEHEHFSRQMHSYLKKYYKHLPEQHESYAKLFGHAVHHEQPSEHINPEKAEQILKDKEVHGHPLSEAQRGMFGAAAHKDK